MGSSSGELCDLCTVFVTETRKEGVIWACGFRHHGKVIIVEPVQWQESGGGCSHQHKLPASRERKKTEWGEKRDREEREERRQEVGRINTLPKYWQ